MENRNPYRMQETVYMTAGIKRHLLKCSEEIQNALRQFRNGDMGKSSDKPANSLITEFGSYELSFGVIFIISYKLFTDRDFVTVLLKDEYEEGENRA